MEGITENQEGRHVAPVQYFNGKPFRKHKGERYYSNGRTRMHRYVWEFYNGKIPKGYDIHHKDGNTDNNTIENLECITEEEHNRKHAEERKLRGVSEKQRQHLAHIQELAKQWHASPEGLEWHRQHGIKGAQNVPEREAV